MYFRRIQSLAVLALLTSTASAAAQDLTSQLAYKVVTIAANGEETLEDRDMVRPGDVVHYEVVHRNGTDGDVEGLAIAMPVPQGMTIALGHEQSSLPARFEVQAELDPETPGLEWSTLPAMRIVIADDGTRRQEPLPHTEIISVRWQLEAALPSGEIATNAYRVTVN